MDKFISLISVYAKTYYFPNPFENIMVNYFQNNSFYSASALSIASIINYGLGAVIISKLSYNLVQQIYRKYSCPLLGLALYMIMFLTNSFIIIGITTFFKSISVDFLLFIIAYAILWNALGKISEKFYDFY